MRSFLRDQSGVAVIEYVVISSIMGITLALALPLLLRPLSEVFNLFNPGPNFE